VFTQYSTKVFETLARIGFRSSITRKTFPSGVEVLVFALKRAIIVILMLLTLLFPVEVNALAPPRRAPSNNQALVMSSLNQTVPMGNYAHNLIYYLTQAGYNVTYLTDGAVTVDLLVNNLNSYSVVVWRTNAFTWVHTNYWYVGEKINSATEQKYAADFAAGYLNDKTGIFGVDTDFVNEHFGPNTLSGVKLLILIASDGNSIAPQLVTAGVSSVIFCNGNISLQFGLIDDLMVQMVAYLSKGENVYTAVYNTLTPVDQGQTPEDNLDKPYSPPFWYAGNDALTIV